MEKTQLEKYINVEKFITGLNTLYTDDAAYIVKKGIELGEKLNLTEYDRNTLYHAHIVLYLDTLLKESFGFEGDLKLNSIDND